MPSKSTNYNLRCKPLVQYLRNSSPKADTTVKTAPDQLPEITPDSMKVQFLFGFRERNRIASNMIRTVASSLSLTRQSVLSSAGSLLSSLEVVYTSRITRISGDPSTWPRTRKKALVPVEMLERMLWMIDSELQPVTAVNKTKFVNYDPDAAALSTLICRIGFMAALYYQDACAWPTSIEDAALLSAQCNPLDMPINYSWPSLQSLDLIAKELPETQRLLVHQLALRQIQRGMSLQAIDNWLDRRDVPSTLVRPVLAELSRFKVPTDTRAIRFSRQ